MSNVVEEGKKVVQGFKKHLKKIIKACKFFMTQVGWGVALLILVIVLLIIIGILVKSLGHALAKWLSDEYAGISDNADYEYLVSSVGYAGYDSFITEDQWQDFMAYEYAVLMDVAEYLYEGQQTWKDTNQFTKVTLQGGASSGETINSPNYLPYLPVSGEYDISGITHLAWQEAVKEGQASARFGITDPTVLDGATGSYVSYGGNRNVVSPKISYEFKDNKYGEGVGSLVPYISILREELKYKYYTVGGRKILLGICS